MKLSKVFLVVVALHGLLIGSIFYIGGCRTPGVEMIDAAPGPDYRVPPPPPPVTAPPTTRRPSPAVIRPDDVRLPRVAPTAPSPRAAAGEQEYVIERGDTIWSISQRYGVSMQEILDRNGLTEESAGRIRVGQKIILPRGASPAPRPDAAHPPARPPVESAAPTPPRPAPALTDGTYTVQSGDSLWTISRRYGTTIDAIRQANRLTSDLLQPGQKLVIPGAATIAPPPPDPAPEVTPPPPPGGSAVPAPVPPAAPRRTETHYLEPNETLADVARKHGISLEELMRLNGITDPNQVRDFGPVLVPAAGE